jgi:Ca-activated chloride channel homolog
MTLTGLSGGTSRSYNYSNLKFPLRSEANDYLPRLWATRRVGWLMEQVRSNGEQKELRDEIVDLGTRYGIVTPYTSYLALEDARVSTVTLPVQGRAQVLGRQSGGQPGTLNAPTTSAPAGRTDNLSTLDATTGAGAVQLSKMAREQQDVKRLKDEASSNVRRIAGKTFYLSDGVWIDSEFKAESRLPERVLRFGTDEYFSILTQYPKLGSYFSLGERVVVVFEGHVYRVK